jgi:sterol 3beta-glucosyltransferase
VRRSGVRAVVSAGWGDARPRRSKNLFVVDGYVPHDWLFQQVSAVVHHGGAGTTAAGLCAGKPTLIIPFGGDQPFWALRVHAKGLGPKPIRREKLTADKLARALTELTATPAYRAAAEALGKRLRNEHGVKNAADVIQKEVTRWLAEADGPCVGAERPLERRRRLRRHLREIRKGGRPPAPRP